MPRHGTPLHDEGVAFALDDKRKSGRLHCEAPPRVLLWPGTEQCERLPIAGYPRAVLVGVFVLSVGLGLLAVHRPLSEFLHASEGAAGDRFGGELRARAVTLLAGVAFTVVGVLAIAGPLG